MWKGADSTEGNARAHTCKLPFLVTLKLNINGFTGFTESLSSLYSSSSSWTSDLAAHVPLNLSFWICVVLSCDLMSCDPNLWALWLLPTGVGCAKWLLISKGYIFLIHVCCQTKLARARFMWCWVRGMELLLLALVVAFLALFDMELFHWSHFYMSQQEKHM